MYSRPYFSNVNNTEILHKQQSVTDFESAILQAYHAGMITRYGSLIIYGTGAERGTWVGFSNVKLENITFTNARESLTWFTNLYSKALRNNGRSYKKKTFYLSQLQEIRPLLSTFGIEDLLDIARNEIKDFDETHNLLQELHENGRIANWEVRTKKVSFLFSDHCKTIREQILGKILMPFRFMGVEAAKKLFNAFNEGTRGLELGSDDILKLLEGNRLINIPRPKWAA